MNETAPPARPPSLKQLEAWALKAQKARRAGWLKVGKARAALCEALNDFEEDLLRENEALESLSAARGVKVPSDFVQQTRAETPAPPAPETLTGADEED
jgi:hypothetical protein